MSFNTNGPIEESRSQLNIRLIMICLVKCQEIWEVTGCELCVSDTEDASETDLAKHDENDYVELKEQ